jgi:hypothetical protein
MGSPSWCRFFVVTCGTEAGRKATADQGTALQDMAMAAHTAMAGRGTVLVLPDTEMVGRTALELQDMAMADQSTEMVEEDIGLEFLVGRRTTVLLVEFVTAAAIRFVHTGLELALALGLLGDPIESDLLQCLHRMACRSLDRVAQSIRLAIQSMKALLLAVALLVVGLELEQELPGDPIEYGPV